MIFYEAPHRLKDTLSNMLDVLGDRDVCLEREISKIHEEVIRNKLSEIVKIADQRWNTTKKKMYMNVNFAEVLFIKIQKTGK